MTALPPRIERTACAALLLATLAAGCGDGPTSPGLQSRAYRMGFSAIPSRPDTAILIPTLEMWAQRADAALMLFEPPWDSLLAGTAIDSLVRRETLPLAQYYRGKNFPIVLNVDPANGLDRSSDSAPLVAAGRSLTEPAIRQLFRDYVVALDTIIRPDYLGLASETNLIRIAAPGALYDAVRQNAVDAAAAVRIHDADVSLFVSVQVETAWGLLPPGGAYVGIATDLADFSFAQSVALSSYPYFAWAEPESLPLDYYSRLVQGSGLPVMVIEGGWTSAGVDTFESTPAEQARYIPRHAAILDRAAATAVFQITFTDLDLSSFPPLPPGSILPLFAHLGLVTEDLVPKPALAEWDRVFARPRR